MKGLSNHYSVAYQMEIGQETKNQGLHQKNKFGENINKFSNEKGLTRNTQKIGAFYAGHTLLRKDTENRAIGNNMDKSQPEFIKSAQDEDLIAIQKMMDPINNMEICDQ
jgi:hypothetical protein